MAQITMSKRLIVPIALFAITLVRAAPTAISVGWDVYPPYQISTSGSQRGIDMDIITAALDGAGYRVSFQQLPWSRQLLMSKTGELDVVMNASQSADREEYASWSIGYRPERAALITRTSNTARISHLSQLIGQNIRIGAIRDSVYPGEYDEYLAKPAFQQLLEFTPSNLANLKKLYAGHLDYIIDDPVTIQHQASKQFGKSVRIVFELLNSPTFFMVSKQTLARQPDFLAKLNASIAAMQAKGTTKKIFLAYGVSQ